MTKELDDIAHKVRVLELEARELELTAHITQLKAEQSIDEDCIGCAGPCKVVDVAAKLQKELDECNERCAGLGSHNMQLLLDRKAIIEELKDRNAEDLNELYALDKKEIDRLKDRVVFDAKHIGRLNKVITSHINEIRDLETLIDEKDKMLEKQGREISGLLCLRDMYDGLKAELGILKGCGTANTLYIAGLKKAAEALEAELSARKQDSEVLMKVVETVSVFERSDRNITQYAIIMDRINALLKDYLDAPKGPPETPIDELYKITVSYAFLELP